MALLTPTVESFRIDKRVRDFYAERSIHNAWRASYSIVSLFATCVMTKQFGAVQTLASIIPANFAVNQLVEWIKKGAYCPPPPFFPARGVISGIAFGAAASVVCVPLNQRIGRAAWDAIQAMGIQSSSRQQVAVLLQTPGYSGMMVVLWGVVFAPVVEEILFRSYLFRDELFTTEKSENTHSY